MENITGKTSTGFEYTIDKRVLTDWDFVSLLGTLTDKEIKESVKLANMRKLLFIVLGEEQTNSLISHVRDLNDGYAPIEEVMKELGEITSVKN